MGFETIKIKNRKWGQAIRIPRKMKIDDDIVYLRKMGNALYIIPFHDPWRSLIESIENFTSDFMEDRQQPANQKRDTFN